MYRVAESSDCTQASIRVSSRKLYQGGSSVIIMKGGHDQMKSGCGFYS